MLFRVVCVDDTIYKEDLASYVKKININTHFNTPDSLVVLSVWIVKMLA